eukprot:537368-Lingulodinium_polyedra.AAC.1
MVSRLASSTTSAVEAPNTASVKDEPGMGRFATGTLPGKEALQGHRQWGLRGPWPEKALARRQRSAPSSSPSSR